MKLGCTPCSKVGTLEVETKMANETFQRMGQQ